MIVDLFDHGNAFQNNKESVILKIMTQRKSTHTPIPLLFLILILFFSKVSSSQTLDIEESGNWFSVYLTEERAWVAGTLSEKSNENFFTVRFDAQDNCKANVIYSRPSPPANERVPDGILDRTLELRVDKNEVWEVSSGSALVSNGLSVDGTSAVYSINFFVTLEFVLELTTGNYLRMFDKGNQATERFSLKGSKNALSRAFTNCEDQVKSQNSQTPDFKQSPPTQPSQQKQFKPMQSI